jgi:hypothetical protein
MDVGRTGVVPERDLRGRSRPANERKQDFSGALIRVPSVTIRVPNGPLGAEMELKI